MENSNKQLKGTFYCVADDFAYTDVRLFDEVNKDDETNHSVTKIDNVLIDENMIKFYVPPFSKEKGGDIGYNVNLLINEDGSKYTGQFSADGNPDDKGDVDCQLFTNKTHYMLYGQWHQFDDVYTWWAIINQKDNQI